jgi:hypothetical protein
MNCTTQISYGCPRCLGSHLGPLTLRVPHPFPLLGKGAGFYFAPFPLAPRPAESLDRPTSIQRRFDAHPPAASRLVPLRQSPISRLSFL